MENLESVVFCGMTRFGDSGCGSSECFLKYYYKEKVKDLAIKHPRHDKEVKK